MDERKVASIPVLRMKNINPIQANVFIVCISITSYCLFLLFVTLHIVPSGYKKGQRQRRHLSYDFHFSVKFIKFARKLRVEICIYICPHNTLCIFIQISEFYRLLCLFFSDSFYTDGTYKQKIMIGSNSSDGQFSYWIFNLIYLFVSPHFTKFESRIGRISKNNMVFGMYTNNTTKAMESTIHVK